MSVKSSQLHNIFVCPISNKRIRKSGNKFICDDSGLTYEIKSGVPIFMTGEDTDSLNEFWDLGWDSRYNSGDHQFHKKKSEEYKKIVEKKVLEAKQKNTPIVSAISSEEEIVLNIGCGLDEASQLALLGAKRYIGIDYSYVAAKASLESLKKLGNYGVTAQANAEFLPIKTESVDLVYSSGVLHHTPNINKAVEEVYRVLKHGGRAVIGLYNKNSPKFIMARIIGTLRSIFIKKQMSWFQQTETAWKTDSSLGPYTSTFSKKQLLKLFNDNKCSDIAIRVTGFQWGDVVPVLGKYFAKTSLGSSSADYLSPKFGSMWVITFKKNEK